MRDPSKPGHRALLAPALCCLFAATAARAQNSAPTADDDTYRTAAGDNLSVDAPGVLDNDADPDGDPLTATLVDDPVSGGVAHLLADGSFEYEPPNGFVGTDHFTYQAYDGTAFSNVATVEIEVTGAPGLAVFVDEAAFRAALAALQLEATTEGFEDPHDWGAVRSTIVDGNFTAASIDSMGVRWTGNNPASEVTTSNGAASTGLWGFYELPHGSYLTGVDCQLPGNCTDGFVATSAATLYGVGGWIRGFFGSKVEFILDGEKVPDFGTDAILGTGHRFLGVIDAAGFRSLEVRELEGTVGDAKYIWADDVTFGSPAGISLTVLPGASPSEVTLQWLGGPSPFSVFRSADPGHVLDPGNLLGQTANCWWDDLPPPGDLFFYRVVAP